MGSTSSTANTMRQFSPVWSYYDVLFKDEIKYGCCKTCKGNVKCSKGATTGLFSHLKIHHKEVYQELKQEQHDGADDSKENKLEKDVDKNRSLFYQRSPIWFYYDQFYEGEKKFGTCKTCQINVICSGGGSTTGLAVHLKTRHKEVYKEFKQKKSDGIDYADEVETKTVNNVEEIADLVVPSPIEFTQPISCETLNTEVNNKIRSEKLVLSGEDFGNDLMNVFKELANDEDFTNVTLVTDGGRILKAHKVVLSSFSPFFKALLVNNAHQHPLLYLRGVQYEDLRGILDFIYLGQTKVEMHQVNRFIDLATDLQIKGLRTDGGIDGGTEGGTEGGTASASDGRTAGGKAAVHCKSTGNENVQEDYSFLNNRDGVVNELNSTAIKKENVSLTDPLYFYACHLCEYQAEIKSVLISHIETTHTEGINSCNQCDFNPVNHQNLLEHKEQCHRTSKTLLLTT